MQKWVWWKQPARCSHPPITSFLPYRNNPLIFIQRITIKIITTLTLSQVGNLRHRRDHSWSWSHHSLRAEPGLKPCSPDSQPRAHPTTLHCLSFYFPLQVSPALLSGCSQIDAHFGDTNAVSQELSADAYFCFSLINSTVTVPVGRPWCTQLGLCRRRGGRHGSTSAPCYGWWRPSVARCLHHCARPQVSCQVH